MAAVLGALRAHIRAGDTVPFEIGRTDCSLWVADWVRQRTGVDLAKNWRGMYRTRPEYLRLLVANGSLVRVADRALLQIGAKRIPAPTAKPGDVGIIATEDGPALAIRAEADWVAKTGDRVSHSPAALFAWRI